MSQETPQPDEQLVDAAVEYARQQLNWSPNDEEVAAIRANAERHAKMAATMRAVSLRNADEPDFIFRPYRSEG